MAASLRPDDVRRLKAEGAQLVEVLPAAEYDNEHLPGAVNFPLKTLGFGAVYDYTAGKSDWLAAGLRTGGQGAARPRPGALARTDVPTCLLDEPVAVARDRVASSDEERCAVASTTGVVVGSHDADALSWAVSSSGCIAATRPPSSLPTPRVVFWGPFTARMAMPL